MARGKRGPALIELIDKAEDSSTRVPNWWRGRGEETVQGDAPRGGSHVAQPAQGGVDAPESDWGAPRGFLSVRGDRVVMSLTSVSAGIAVFVLILLVGASFLIGRREGRAKGLVEGFERGKASVGADALSEIEAARKTAPNREIFDGLASNPVDGHEPPKRLAPESNTPSIQAEANEGDSVWVKDHTYIVVQEFKAGDRSDAEAAKLFLAGHGVETVILDSSGNYPYRLVATKGFNRDDPAQREWCDAFHDKIKRLGDQFVKAGGRYDLQGYQKRVTGNGW
jgi:hypothetical protein